MSTNRFNLVRHAALYVKGPDQFVYPMCPLAKQHMLPFHLRDSTAFTCFELIHMDIWGPFSTISIHGHKFFLNCCG